jgi:NADH-quinone oxidoreductase subunit L
MGLFQYDIKKVLAYSTVSQLGFMFIGVGVGAYWAGVFHLLTHACFKACLFLGSGSVILGCHHEQDMRRMGGLQKYMPSTRMTYALACFAIAGFPVAAGFASKDEILWKAFTSSAVNPGFNYAIWGMGIAAATLTAFYMYRSYYMTFTGDYRGNDVPLVDPYPVDTARAKEMFIPKPVRGPSEELLKSLAEHGHGHEAHGHGGHDAHGHDAHGHDDHGHDDHGHDDHGHGHAHTPHESPWTMTVPLWALGLASIFIGVIVGFPPVVASLLHLDIHPALEVWLEPVLAPSVEVLKHYDATRANVAFLGDVHAKHTMEYALAGLSVLVALVGWLSARWLYKDNKNPLPAKLLDNPSEVVGGLAGLVRGVHRVVYNKYFVDEAYYSFFVYGMARFWNLLRNVDVYIVDGIVNSVAFVGKSFGIVQGAIDKYLVDGAVNLVADVVMAAGQKIRTLQTGQIRTYLLGAFGGAVAAFLVLIAFS